MKLSSNSPIGFFDSGMGGLTLLSEAIKLMPKEKFIYYGDNANAPYGNLSDKQIFEYTLLSINYLLSKNCKIIVIACNTATAVAVKKLRSIFKCPIIGIEPAVNLALKETKTKKILLLATEATLRNRNYNDIAAKNNTEVINLSCKNLAAYIEQNFDDYDKVYTYINDLLMPMRGQGIDSIVLGCTHYVLKKDVFEKICGYSVKVYDGNFATALNLQKTLASASMLSKYKKNKMPEFILTLGDEETKKYYSNITKSLLS